MLDLKYIEYAKSRLMGLFNFGKKVPTASLSNTERAVNRIASEMKSPEAFDYEIGEEVGFEEGGAGHDVYGEFSNENGDEMVFNATDTDAPWLKIKRTVAPTVNGEPEGKPQKPEVEELGRATQGEVHTFIEYLIQSDRKKVFEFLQELHFRKIDQEMFICTTLCELDKVLSYRLGKANGNTNEHLLDISSKLTEEELEELVVLLITGIDHTYRSPQAGVKVAILRVLDFIHSTKR